MREPGHGRPGHCVPIRLAQEQQEEFRRAWAWAWPSACRGHRVPLCRSHHPAGWLCSRALGCQARGEVASSGLSAGGVTGTLGLRGGCGVTLWLGQNLDSA